MLFTLNLLEIEITLNQIVDLLRYNGLSTFRGTVFRTKRLGEGITCGYVLCALEHSPNMDDVDFTNSEPNFDA